MESEYFLKFFDDYIYKEEWKEKTDKNIIINDFQDYINTLSAVNQIRILCYCSNYNLKEIQNILNDASEQYIKTTISRLNKKTELKIIKKNDGLNKYELTSKGLSNLLTSTSDFFRENKYIKEFTKYEIDNNNIFDHKEILKGFQNYITDKCKNQIKNIINNDCRSLYLDYDSILEYDYKLIDSLLDYPQQSIIILRESINNFIEDKDNTNKINVRINNLPNSQKIKIGGHRKKHISQLISFEGIIRRKSDVKPRLEALNYICTNPSCNNSENKIRVPQFEEKAKTIKTCPKCKSGVELIDRELEDSMILILEESFNDRSSDFDSKKIHIKIDSDLTDELNYNKLKISKLIRVTGILKEVNDTTKNGSLSVNYNYMLEANNITFLEEDEDIKLSQDDKKQIQDLSKQNNVLEIIKDNYLPSIYDYEILKKALILQHIGSSFDDYRNDSHILLLGDPSTAKSKIIIEHLSYSPRYIYSSGTSSTQAGMTACAIKDSLTGSFVLEPGVLPRANRGIAGTDELDKLDKEDADCMTEALEQQKISVNKANISAQLQTQCSLIAGANPKYSKFDYSLPIDKQITFNSALISRFDLVFILRDEFNEERDKELIKYICKKNDDKNIDIKLSKEFIKKYLYYCKINFKPNLGDDMVKKLEKYYVETRRHQNVNNIIRFTPRQIEGILRFASSHAKLNQRNKIIEEDMKVAFDLFNYCFKELINN